MPGPQVIPDKDFRPLGSKKGMYGGWGAGSRKASGKRMQTEWASQTWEHDLGADSKNLPPRLLPHPLTGSPRKAQSIILKNPRNLAIVSTLSGDSSTFLVF